MKDKTEDSMYVLILVLMGFTKPCIWELEKVDYQAVLILVLLEST